MTVLFKGAELGTLYCLPYLKFNRSKWRACSRVTRINCNACTTCTFLASLRDRRSKGKWNSWAPKFPLPLPFLTTATQAISCIRVKQWSLITWQLQLDNHYLGHSTVCFHRRHHWMPVWPPTRGGYFHTLPIRVCAAQRGNDFEAPDLERGIHFRGVF